MKTIILPTRSPIRRLSLRRGFLLIPLVLVCLGLAPMVQAVGPDTDGSIPGSNNGEGLGVLVNRTTGVWNTGTGFEALNHLTAGNQNTATGLRALTSDTNGGFNTATGVLSLFSNTSGFFNSATGAYSLANNTIASYNTANGYAALYYNTEGEQNTATGHAALYKNTTGVGNTANGYLALYSNTTSNLNTATGYQALYSNTTSGANTANGTYALFNNTGGDNIALGYFAGSLLTTGSNNIDIGNNGVGGESATIRIGSGQTRTFIAGIFGATASGGMQVFINSTGQLGTATSSRRYKKEIKAMEQTSESILALKPVTFHYKSDATDTPQFGLIAEEVAEINPDLVVRDENGEIYSVRYDAVNAMLLNEFLKAYDKMQEQGCKVEQQEATIAELKSTIAELKSGMNVLTATVNEQASQLQKVSDELEVSRPSPQIVVRNQ